MGTIDNKVIDALNRVSACGPVRRQCPEFALRTRLQGIWGGLTELERLAASADASPTSWSTAKVAVG